MSLISFVIKLGLLPYALPSLMPTWRWLLGSTLLAGGLLAALWIQDSLGRSRPDGGSGDILGMLMGVIITINFIAGVTVRAMTLAMSARGFRPGCGIMVTVAGFAGLVAVLVLPVLL